MMLQYVIQITKQGKLIFTDYPDDFEDTVVVFLADIDHFPVACLDGSVFENRVSYSCALFFLRLLSSFGASGSLTDSAAATAGTGSGCIASSGAVGGSGGGVGSDFCSRLLFTA
jgi:hypothetical protein